jgi:hypothetical protein
MAKLNLYAVLTKYDDPDAIDSKAIGEGAIVNPHCGRHEGAAEEQP